MEAQTSIARHYGDGTDVERRVEEELRASGFVSGKELSSRDVAELDQFHVGGAEATEELARLLAPSPGTHVLDIGSGVGGKDDPRNRQFRDVAWSLPNEQ